MHASLLYLRVCCCGPDPCHPRRFLLPFVSGLDEGLAWSGRAGEHNSPIYLSLSALFLCLEPRARTVAPFLLLLAI